MSSGKNANEVEKKEAVEEQAKTATDRRKRTATIACAGCMIAFVIAAVAGIIAATVWDNKDSRLYQGKPLPENVGYIGRWVSDGTIAARIDTFVVAGDRLACDFAIRNDSKQDITVQAIGRTVIGQLGSHWLTQSKIPLSMNADDQPMLVTDDKNTLGLQPGMPPIKLVENENPPPPEPITLKPGEMKRFKYRPAAHQLLMPAAALRLAVQLDDGSEPRAFYFLRMSSGIGAWFEGGAEKIMRGAR